MLTMIEKLKKDSFLSDIFTRMMAWSAEVPVPSTLNEVSEKMKIAVKGLSPYQIAILLSNLTVSRSKMNQDVYTRFNLILSNALQTEMTQSGSEKVSSTLVTYFWSLVEELDSNFSISSIQAEVKVVLEKMTLQQVGELISGLIQRKDQFKQEIYDYILNELMAATDSLREQQAELLLQANAERLPNAQNISLEEIGAERIKLTARYRRILSLEAPREIVALILPVAVPGENGKVSLVPKVNGRDQTNRDTAMLSLRAISLRGSFERLKPLMRVNNDVTISMIMTGLQETLNTLRAEFQGFPEGQTAIRLLVPIVENFNLEVFEQKFEEINNALIRLSEQVEKVEQQGRDEIKGKILKLGQLRLSIFGDPTLLLSARMGSTDSVEEMNAKIKRIQDELRKDFSKYTSTAPLIQELELQKGRFGFENTSALFSALGEELLRDMALVATAEEQAREVLAANRDRLPSAMNIQRSEIPTRRAELVKQYQTILQGLGVSDAIISLIKPLVVPTLDSSKVSLKAGVGRDLAMQTSGIDQSMTADMVPSMQRKINQFLRSQGFQSANVTLEFSDAVSQEEGFALESYGTPERRGRERGPSIKILIGLNVDLNALSDFIGEYYNLSANKFPSLRYILGGSNEDDEQQPARVERIQRPGRIQEDRAMDTKGGIDLNAANLNLQIKRDGKGVPLPISQQNLESIRLEGLIPVILNIKPGSALPLFAEIAKPSLVS